MNADDPIIEKIKKLLRLGQSPNRAEAELAMVRAFELAEKHRVDLESLDLEQREADIVHEWFQAGHRLSYLKRRALSVVMHFFHVHVCLSAPRMVFVGLATDIAIAHYIFEFLVRAGTRLLRAYESGERAARRKINHRKRTQYLAGFIYGITENLGAAKQTHVLTDSQTALVLAEDRARESYMDGIAPDRVNKKVDAGPRHQGALMAGYHDGKATPVHQPLTAAPGAPLALE